MYDTGVVMAADALYVIITEYTFLILAGFPKSISFVLTICLSATRLAFEALKSSSKEPWFDPVSKLPSPFCCVMEPA